MPHATKWPRKLGNFETCNSRITLHIPSPHSQASLWKTSRQSMHSSISPFFLQLCKSANWDTSEFSTHLCLGIPRSCNRLLNILFILLRIWQCQKNRLWSLKRRCGTKRNNNCCTECLFRHCKEKETKTFAKGEKTRTLAILRLKSPKAQYGTTSLRTLESSTSGAVKTSQRDFQHLIVQQAFKNVKCIKMQQSQMQQSQMQHAQSVRFLHALRRHCEDYRIQAQEKPQMQMWQSHTENSIFAFIGGAGGVPLHSDCYRCDIMTMQSVVLLRCIAIIPCLWDFRPRRYVSFRVVLQLWFEGSFLAAYDDLWLIAQNTHRVQIVWITVEG